MHVGVVQSVLQTRTCVWTSFDEFLSLLNAGYCVTLNDAQRVTIDYRVDKHSPLAFMRAGLYVGSCWSAGASFRRPRYALISSTRKSTSAR